MNSPSDNLTGVGISYRPEFSPFGSTLASVIDCVEVLFEQAFIPRAEAGEALQWGLPTLAHAMSFSPGRADFRIDGEAHRLLAAACHHGVKVLSEHLSLSAVADYSISNFIPCNRTRQDAARIAHNVRRLRAVAGVPVALENPVTFFLSPDDELTEAEFTSLVLSLAECGMLLDVNNLYVNAVNQGYDPYQFIEDIDGNRVSYIHVAGHSQAGDILVDSHSTDVDAEVWSLTDYALRRTAASAVVLERDNNTADEDTILREISILRGIWSRARQ